MTSLEGEMARIFSGRDDRYFAIEWFSPGQLGDFVQDEAIHAGAQAFLTACLATASAIDELPDALPSRAEEFLKRQTELWMGLPSGHLNQPPHEDPMPRPTREPNAPRPPRAYRDEPATVASLSGVR